jgi:hypothetical protein
MTASYLQSGASRHARPRRGVSQTKALMGARSRGIVGRRAKGSWLGRGSSGVLAVVVVFGPGWFWVRM